MFTPVDFISVSKQPNYSHTPETAGSIASNSPSIFSTSTETAGSIACSSPAPTTSSCSFSAVA